MEANGSQWLSSSHFFSRFTLQSRTHDPTAKGSCGEDPMIIRNKRVSKKKAIKTDFAKKVTEGLDEIKKNPSHESPGPQVGSEGR